MMDSPSVSSPSKNCDGLIGDRDATKAVTFACCSVDLNLLGDKMETCSLLVTSGSLFHDLIWDENGWDC